MLNGNNKIVFLQRSNILLIMFAVISVRGMHHA